MAAPTVVSGATTFADTSNGTNHTINRPSSYQSGDLAFFVCCLDTAALGSGASLTKPSEFTTEHYANQAVAGNDAVAIGSVWMLTAGGSEPSTYTCTSSGSERASGLMFFLRGHNGVDVKSVSANTGNSLGITFPAVTTTVDDCLILRVLIADSQAGATLPVDLGSGYTLLAADEAGSSGLVHVQYITQASAGSTGTLSVNMNASDQWATWTIAIAPDSGITVGLNSLTLAGSVPTMGITVAGPQTVNLSSISLTAEVQPMLASITGGIPIIPPDPLSGVARFLVANHFGQIIADMQGWVGDVSWRMNTHGKAKITFAKTDPQATEQNLRFHNRAIIQFDNGLPDWAGVIINRDWQQDYIEIELLSAEYLLGFYRTDRGRYFTKATAGYIFESVIKEALSEYQTGIGIGTVFGGGPLHSPSYHIQSLYNIIKDSVCGRLSDYEFDLTPKLVRGRIELEANLYERRGGRKSNVWLLDGQNAFVESYEEQGPVINHWVVAGADVSGETADGWGDGRLIAEYIDEGSRGLYGRAMDAEVFGGVEDQGEIEEAARFLTRQTAVPREAICVTSFNRLPAQFKDYGVGDSVRVIAPDYGFYGVDGFYRILGREYSADKGVCGLVLETDYE